MKTIPIPKLILDSKLDIERTGRSETKWIAKVHNDMRRTEDRKWRQKTEDGILLFGRSRAN